MIRNVCDGSAVDQMIAKRVLPPNSRRPASTDKLTFNQNRSLLFNRDHWDKFDSMFDTMRELVNAEFDDVEELRIIRESYDRCQANSASMAAASPAPPAPRLNETKTAPCCGVYFIAHPATAE